VGLVDIAPEQFVKHCVELGVPAFNSIQGINAVYQTPRVDDDVDAAEWIVDLDRLSSLGATE